MLLPAVIWWLGNGHLENVSAGKVAICIQCPPVGACGPVRPIGATLPTACAAGPFSWSRGEAYVFFDPLGSPASAYKQRITGDAHVFFDPLGSWVPMLSSNNQSLAPHNGCQEVVSKGGLDRFIRQALSSIALTVNTLGANNKSHQLSRRSKCKPAQMFKNEGPMNPDFGEITQQLCNSQGADGKGTIFNT